MASRNRQRRVNEVIREVIAESITRDLSDPRLGMVTITQVEASPDVRHAKVWWTVLQSSRREASAQALESARGVLQGQIARQLATRHTPQLTFLYDEQQEQARRISRLIDEVAPAGEPPPPVAGEGDDA